QKKQEQVMSVLKISRKINYPIETVFQAWSKAGHIQQWWGQDGVDTIIKSFVFNPGGIFHYAFVLPDGNKMWGKYEYVKINEPDQIIFINSFSDEKGSTVKADENIFGKDWPLTILNTITLTPSGNGTILDLEAVPFDVSQEEEAHFENHIKNLEEAFGTTFDRMENFLATQ